MHRTPVNIGRRAIFWCWLGLVGSGWGADQTTVRLTLDTQVARPGQTVMAAVDIKLRSGWHTYWRNGGDSGAPPKIKWTLPAGVSAGEILWPVPVKVTEEGLITYTLNDEAVLLVPLAVAPDAAPGARDLKAEVSWLECEKQCVPASGETTAKLTIGNEGKPSGDAAWIAGWQQRLPQPAEPGVVRAAWDGEASSDGLRKLVLDGPAATGAQRAEFFPDAADKFTVRGETESSVADGQVRVRKRVEKSKDADWPAEVRGLLVTYNGAGKPGQALEIKAAISGAPTGKLSAPEGVPKGAASVPLMLLYAFIGGLILNVMPCVLPVIALKIFGFVRQSHESPRRVRQLGLVYTLGVVGSFVVLAAIAIGLQSAGKQASWGMQFGSPVFLVGVTTLMTLIALNLFGVFEVTLGGKAMTAASTLASREGATGAFFNGVFATALATSCTAPVLGAALGWALVQPPLLILAAFVMVGLGLAFPYLLLTWSPPLMRFLPKPGAWMEHFKVIVGFAAMGAAIWLFTIALDHYGDRSLWLGMFLLLVALAAWVFGQFYQRTTERRAAGLVIAVLLLAGSYAFVLEGPLNWRHSQPPNVSSGAAMEEGGIAWQPWSHEAVEAARREGRVVFVDFTAKWCTTCQANKRTSIEVASVREKLKALGAVTLLGDYTRVPDDITRELKRFGRAGVPLVLVYPKDGPKPPLVLPELLTPSIVLAALDAAVR